MGYGGNSAGLIAGGGGGGYFGGSGSYGVIHRNGSGAGGSSFISGYNGCYAFSSPSSDKTSPNQNIHYSGLYFTNSQMHSGDESFHSPNGSIEQGHLGDGFIRITIITKYPTKQYQKLSFPRPDFIFF